MYGGRGIPDEEDDDGRDDEDQQEDGDTERLLLVGGLQFALHRFSATVRIQNLSSGRSGELTLISSSNRSERVSASRCSQK